eukprot:1893611-Amphidinium_carterae.1
MLSCPVGSHSFAVFAQLEGAEEQLFQYPLGAWGHYTQDDTHLSIPWEAPWGFFMGEAKLCFARHALVRAASHEQAMSHIDSSGIH